MVNLWLMWYGKRPSHWHDQCMGSAKKLSSAGFKAAAILQAKLWCMPINQGKVETNVQISIEASVDFGGCCANSIDAEG